MKEIILPAAVPTGIFLGRIVLSLPNKPEEKLPFSAHMGEQCEVKYVESIAVLSQPLHLTH